MATKDKKSFDWYLSRAIERKLVEKAQELEIEVSVTYKSSTDTSHLKIGGNHDNYAKFADYASNLILDKELSRTIKFKYA